MFHFQYSNENIFVTVLRMILYYKNTNEIPGELSHENLISSHVKNNMLSSHEKISPLLWLHDKLCPSHQKTIKVEWFGSSLVFR